MHTHTISQIKLLAQEAAAVEEDDFDLAHDVKKLVDQLDVLEVVKNNEQSSAFRSDGWVDAWKQNVRENGYLFHCYFFQ